MNGIKYQNCAFTLQTNQQITNKLDEKSGGSSVIIERQMPDGNQENEK